jgi:predicted nucleic acid-binding Zn ribbon protein
MAELPGAGRRREHRRSPHPDLPLEDKDQLLGGSIDAYLQTTGLGGARALSELDASWAEIVGTEVAKHCRPAKIEGRTLVVAVDHPAWATQLSFLSRAIVERATEVLGTGVLDDVKVHVRGRFGVD